MADTTDTPPTSPPTGDAPATPRRRGPRKTGTAAKTPSTRRKAAASTVDQAEAAVKATATRVKRGAVKAEGAVVEAAKDAAKAVTPRGSGRGKAKAATKTTRKAAAKKSGKGGGWGVAAIAGGLAAAGAAAAALLSLKSSSAAKGDAPADPAKGAHQPDGSDSSKSFQAGIADENSVPN